MTVKTPRLYICDPIAIGEEINLLPAQMHYLGGVLRMKDGDSVRIFNGQDGEWMSSFHPQNKKVGCLTPTKNLRPQPSMSARVHLLFAPIKKQRMDFLVEKAVELGVTDFHPLLTQNTEVRKLNEERIHAQIIEAAEQCERLTLPKLHALDKLETACQHWAREVPLLVGLERHDCLPIAEAKVQQHGSDVSFLVGPEGGFTQIESEMLCGLDHVTPVNLGDTILRAETAALYGLVHLCS